MFALSAAPIDRDDLTRTLNNHGAGAIVVFEGWVRNHNEGKAVRSLEYQVYEELALKEGEKILQEACEKFNLHAVVATHRHGHLALGEIAVWIGATASHRDDAFKATRYVIDEIKHRLPVWKKEHYVNEDAQWVFCKHHHHHVHFEEPDYYKKQQGLVAQERLKNARVLVVGAGGLGCPALIGLTQAGVGHITIVDHDRVSLSNLHRQSLYAPNLVGEKKAVVARTVLSGLNPFITVTSIPSSFSPAQVPGHDLVLDCTDNMQTKFQIHDACFRSRVPLVSAGIFKYQGQLRTFVPGRSSGCLRCHGGAVPDDGLLGNCNDNGVLGATVNVLGSLQASEAIQFLSTGASASTKETIYLDLQQLTQLRIKNTAAVGCECCAGGPAAPEFALEITSEQLSSQEFVFIDVRDRSDAEVRDLTPSDRPVVLCCHRGVRSKRLAEDLRSQGHAHVYSLQGGACSL